MASSIIQDVFAELVGGRIHVKAPYADGDGPVLAKQVGAGRWDGKTKTWVYPVDMITCRALRSVYRDRLDIGPALWQWANDEKKREDLLPKMATQETDEPLPGVAKWAPDLDTALRWYQRTGVAFIRAAAKPGEGVLLADQPRTGKTPTAIAAVLECVGAGLHLVVCPRLSVRNVWVPAIHRWTDLTVFAPTSGKREEKEDVIQVAYQYSAQHPDEPVFLVVNYETVRTKGTKVKEHQPEFPLLFTQPLASVVVDESHKVFGSLRVNKGTQAGVGLKFLPLRSDGIKIAMTGTPFGKGGRVMGMFGTLHWLRPKVYTSFWRWAERHLEVEDGEYGKKVGGLKRGTDMDDFFKALGTVILRRTRAEVMPWLGGKIYEDVYVPMTATQARQYKKMETNANVDGMTAAGVLAELTRLRQFSNCAHDIKDGNPIPTMDSGKLAALVERLDEHGIGKDWDGVEKAIVFTQFEQWVSPIRSYLLHHHGIDSVAITGKVSDARREVATREFQLADGGPPVILMTTQTGGVSITLDRASAVHMLDEMWNPEDNEQAEDRAVDTEATTGDAVAVYYYRSEGTIEEYVRDTNKDKAADQHTVLDARRGIEYARQLKGGTQ